jgi:hypothetical protein
MGDYRLRVTMAREGETLDPSHDYEDVCYVMAVTEDGARAAALATWPRIRAIHSVWEVWN